MALTTTTADRALLQLAELLIKQAQTEGLDASQGAALMTLEQYNASGTVARDTYRELAAGLFQALRALPVQLPSYTVAGVPAAATYQGALIFVTNDAGGAVPAFSDGSVWRRVTDRNTVS